MLALVWDQEGIEWLHANCGQVAHPNTHVDDSLESLTNDDLLPFDCKQSTIPMGDEQERQEWP